MSHVLIRVSPRREHWSRRNDLLDIRPWAKTEAAFYLRWTPTDPCVLMFMIFRCRCIDPDLYISCLQCMDWMFANELIVPGTVVYYDDVSIIKVHH